LLASDPGKAGDGVTAQLQRAMPRSVQMSRVHLPADEDCASVPREGLATALERAMDAA
jgi:hypothetical protein